LAEAPGASAAAGMIEPLLTDLPAPDRNARAAVMERAARVLRPSGALRRLDELAVWLAGWQRTDRPRVESPAVLLFAADHGVVEEGVNAYPPEVTAAMVKALEEGVATASALARGSGAALRVVDVGVGRPTANMVHGPALDRETFRACLETGREAVRDTAADLLALGEMGIGNTTAAAALCALLFDEPAVRWTGRGAGLDDDGLRRKVQVVDRARRRARGADPAEALRQVGGGELVAVAGATLEARRRGIPVVLDGFVVTAAVMPLVRMERDVLAHCLAGHLSPEPGHAVLLRHLGLDPVLDLELRLGEGSGALLAIPILRMACSAVTEVATFEEWGLT
jgi:nicotinate-nucleotide--dimethylbenzimidazole phosphoribosyltransferase